MYACICVWWWVGTRKHAIQVSYACCIRKFQPASTHMIKTEWLFLFWFGLYQSHRLQETNAYSDHFFSNNRNNVNRIRFFYSSFLFRFTSIIIAIIISIIFFNLAVCLLAGNIFNRCVNDGRYANISRRCAKMWTSNNSNNEWRKTQNENCHRNMKKLV